MFWKKPMFERIDKIFKQVDERKLEELFTASQELNLKKQWLEALQDREIELAGKIDYNIGDGWWPRYDDFFKKRQFHYSHFRLEMRNGFSHMILVGTQRDSDRIMEFDFLTTKLEEGPFQFELDVKNCAKKEVQEEIDAIKARHKKEHPKGSDWDGWYQFSDGFKDAG